MEVCELCRSPLNSNGRRIQCPGCKRFLCDSCNELKSKLLWMTNGYSDLCGCSLLQEIVAPEVKGSEDKRHYPERHGDKTEHANIIRKESSSSLEDGRHSDTKQSTPNIVKTEQTKSEDINHYANAHEEKTNVVFRYPESKPNNEKEDAIIEAGQEGNSEFQNRLHGDGLPPNGIQSMEYLQSNASNISIIRKSKTESVQNVVPFVAQKEVSSGAPTVDPNNTQKEVPIADLKVAPIGSQTEVPSDDVKEVPVTTLKEIYNDTPKEVPTNASKEILSDAQKEVPSAAQKEVSLAALKEVPTGAPKEVPIVSIKDVPSDAQKEVPAASHKEVLTNDLKEVPTDALKHSISQSSDDTSLFLKPGIPQVKKDKPSSPSSKPKKKLSKHTCAGCGRRDCEGQFMKMMKAMERAAKDNNYSIHNVVPDGNCMFAAVADQLEINGDYSFSPKSLRLACVEHLKSNPESEDGTHYEMFMDGESWTEYLNRMTQEGQWGDHLMLQAISQVTRRDIEVLQGGGKQEVTKITTNLAKDNQQPVRLGHVGEFHYVSLREASLGDQDQFSSDDEELLSSLNSLSLNFPVVFQEARKRDMFLKEDYIDPFSEVPSLHLSFLLRKLLPVNVAVNEGDRSMHTIFPLEYHDDNMAADDPKGTDQNTEQMDRLPTYKAIGDVANGLYLNYLYWMEINKNEAGESNADWKEVPVLFIQNHVHTYRYRTYEQDKYPVVIKTDETHPGYASLLTYNPMHWRIVDSQERPAYIPNHYKLFRILERQWRNDSKETKPVSCLATFYGKYMPTLRCRWPEEAAEWKTRTRPSNWPSATIISSIEADGCHLLPGAHPNSLNPDKEFEFCFGVAERTLCNEALSRDQRYCLMVFMALCSEELKGSTLITNEHLKRVFFYACEDLPDECWTSHLGSCMFYLLESLIAHLERKDIPCYFISQNNTIDHLSETQIEEVVEKIGGLRLNPLQNVLSLTKDRELGFEILQVISQDIEEFRITLSVRESVLNCFIPHAIKVARDNIVRRRFKTAMDTLQTAYEDRLTVATCDDQVPFQSFFNEAVQGIPLDSQWWFLLYSDEKLGMTMSSDMSMNLQPVTLGELVDPVTAKDYAYHLIPQAMAYNTCQLLMNFAWFLLCKYRTQQAIDYLLLCITTYRERLDLEENPACPPETIEKYHDFNERNMYKVLIYLYSALYRQKQESSFVNYFEIVRIVCERLNVCEAYYKAYTLATTMDENWAKYWDGRYRSCRNSDPSLNDGLFLETIIAPDF